MKKRMVYFFLVIGLMAITPAVKAQYQTLFNDQSFNWGKIQVDIDTESKHAFIKQLLQKPAFARIANISYELLLNDFHFLAIYSKGSTGTAIAKHIDQSGRLWWFVVMDHYKKPSRSLFAPRNHNMISYKSTGWMSSRFLTVKN
jgi:hypothetical protein